MSPLTLGILALACSSRPLDQPAPPPEPPPELEKALLQVESVPPEAVPGEDVLDALPLAGDADPAAGGAAEPPAAEAPATEAPAAEAPAAEAPAAEAPAAPAAD